MFIINVSKKYKNKTSDCRLLVESFRDENGKPRHRTILNLSKVNPVLARVIENQVKGKTMVAMEELKQTDNKSLGEIAILKKFSDSLRITAILQKHLGKDHADRILAMAINRVSLPKARYSLCEWLETTCLPDLLGRKLSHFHYNQLYASLFVLEKKQQEIEKDLFTTTAKLESGMTLMLYDITSTYLEGEENELGFFGYNRDGKKGKKQIVVSLVVTPKGRPVSVEILKGNTADKSTLLAKIDDLQKRFGVKDIIYVFDRGMKDEKKLETLRGSQIEYITALNRKEIEALIEKGAPVQPGLFDKTNLLEYTIENRRFILCKSDTREKSQKTREALLLKTEEKLESIEQQVANKKLKDAVKISAKVAKWINKWSMKKYFNCRIEKGLFTFERNDKAITQSILLDQLYVLETTDKKLSKEAVQAGYKNLKEVEDSFRTIKSSLEIRPVNHRKEETTKGHVIVCFLAYYLKKEIELSLKPLLSRHTFSSLLTNLREIHQSVITASPHSVTLINELTPLQTEILSTLHMRLSPIPVKQK